ncbi:hypothetical protein JTE90_005387 [Oedothorax gibbosus]|uniref:Uncharacterized protein n=1 Tax=Oedothorax gibbosus TaxID=931172 RepID=A0AAV6V5W5_9ARAC|nr:hypothetical protein JTE90_005387 [Oedothorax gibbosus]
MIQRNCVPLDLQEHKSSKCNTYVKGTVLTMCTSSDQKASTQLPLSKTRQFFFDKKNPVIKARHDTSSRRRSCLMHRRGGRRQRTTATLSSSANLEEDGLPTSF